MVRSERRVREVIGWDDPVEEKTGVALLRACMENKAGPLGSWTEE